MFVVKTLGISCISQGLWAYKISHSFSLLHGKTLYYGYVHEGEFT